MEAAYVPYEPLETLKPFAEQVWVVDGPEIGMDYLGLTLPFPTRMTIARLPSGKLWVHSPIAWRQSLAGALAELGQVQHIVAPNTLHYWHLTEWQEQFPLARTYGSPDLVRRAKRPLRLDDTLSDMPPDAWEGAFDQRVVRGGVLSEVDFFHRASRNAHPHRPHREFRAAPSAQPSAALVDAGGGRGRSGRKGPNRYAAEFSRASRRG